MIRLNRPVEFDQFLKVLHRRGQPSYLPFYEHIASRGFMARRLGIAPGELTGANPEYWRLFVDFWLGMGYDCVPLEIPLNCPLKPAHHEQGTVSHQSEAQVVIRSHGDVDTYPWPDVSSPIDFRPFDIVSELIPDGVRIVGGVGAGPYEWAAKMMGVMGLAMALNDDRTLVERVFERIGALHISAVRQLASMEAVGALRQGDDLGFKTATFLAPDDLRALVLPIYTAMARHAHEAGKPFILHSCGNLAEIYDDLANECHIDAKHSFEDVIMPVEVFKQRYGSRMTPLGGLDVDTICRGTPEQLRMYTRRKIDACFADGWWALGTGNSLTDYMPVENYLVVLEEAMRYTS